MLGLHNWHHTVSWYCVISDLICFLTPQLTHYLIDTNFNIHTVFCLFVVCLFVYLFICFFVCFFFVCFLFVCLFVCLFLFCLFVCLFVCFLFLFCLFVSFLFVFVCLFVCFFVCFFFVLLGTTQLTRKLPIPLRLILRGFPGPTA